MSGPYLYLGVGARIAFQHDGQTGACKGLELLVSGTSENWGQPDKQALKIRKNDVSTFSRRSSIIKPSI